MLCDVIWLGVMGCYRNDGKYVWNGSCFFELWSESDDYGRLPSEFLVITTGFLRIIGKFVLNEL